MSDAYRTAVYGEDQPYKRGALDYIERRLYETDLRLAKAKQLKNITNLYQISLTLIIGITVAYGVAFDKSSSSIDFFVIVTSMFLAAIGTLSSISPASDRVARYTITKKMLARLLFEVQSENPPTQEDFRKELANIREVSNLL